MSLLEVSFPSLLLLRSPSLKHKAYNLCFKTPLSIVGPRHRAKPLSSQHTSFKPRAEHSTSQTERLSSVLQRRLSSCLGPHCLEEQAPALPPAHWHLPLLCLRCHSWMLAKDYAHSILLSSIWVSICTGLCVSILTRKPGLKALSRMIDLTDHWADTARIARSFCLDPNCELNDISWSLSHKWAKDDAFRHVKYLEISIAAQNWALALSVKMTKLCDFNSAEGALPTCCWCDTSTDEICIQGKGLCAPVLGVVLPFSTSLLSKEWMHLALPWRK